MISPSVLQTTTIGTEVRLGALPTNDIQSSITDLFGMRETTALIARVCPNWIPGKGQTPAGMAVCEYSPNWSTLWENLPFDCIADSVEHYGPTVAGEDSDACYGSSADVLDGAITALWNGYDSTVVSTQPLEKFRPGTILPTSSSAPATAGLSSSSNRIQYKLNATDKTQGFYLSSVGSNQYNWMRLETHTVTGNGVVHSVIWPGRELINNINIASARQTCYELYSKMFDMGGTSNKSFDRSDKRRSRRRGKTKMDASEMKDDI